VKLVTTQVAQGQRASSTGIYSKGFAPPEQMTGGAVYPATDLYALAVTCVTLLTGKQPDELYDSYSNTWTWRAYVQVSDRLEAVLNRMLLASPNQRFQSAKEVLEALNVGKPVPSPSPVVGPPPPKAAPTPSVSTSVQAPSPAVVPSSAAPAPVASRFSLIEFLGGAAFTGFEGGLLTIALVSSLGPVIGGGLSAVVLGVLVFLQSRRIIERIDLGIIAAVTLIAVLLLLNFNVLSLPLNGNPFLFVVVLAALTGCLAIAIAIIFRLIYRILSNLL
jgi:hypothetical protein